MTKKWGLSKIRFYIQGKNLVTLGRFKLWDPEVNANYGNVSPLYVPLQSVQTSTSKKG